LIPLPASLTAKVKRTVADAAATLMVDGVIEKPFSTGTAVSPFGLVTEIDTVPLFPSIVAVIVAVPAVTALTIPLGLTVATDPLFVVQVTLLPDRAMPAASRAVAVS
jgi:hypothetical protein